MHRSRSCPAGPGWQGRQPCEEAHEGTMQRVLCSLCLAGLLLLQLLDAPAGLLQQVADDL